MSKILDFLDKKHNEGLYELMTSQLYTAVLGSIIYLLFDWCYTVYISSLSINEDIIIRALYLLIVIAFYISDFYYIKGTRPYRKWYFILDVLFLIFMLITVKGLNLEVNNLSKLSPLNLNLIKNCFLLFLFLYLLWDIREYNVCKEVQKNYYTEVILWEIVSMILILTISLKYFNVISLLIVLLLITIWFCSISYRKKEHKGFPIFDFLNK